MRGPRKFARVPLQRQDGIKKKKGEREEEEGRGTGGRKREKEGWGDGRNAVSPRDCHG